jgi:hypothetical protein
VFFVNSCVNRLNSCESSYGMYATREYFQSVVIPTILGEWVGVSGDEPDCEAVGLVSKRFNPGSQAPAWERESVSFAGHMT